MNQQHVKQDADSACAAVSLAALLQIVGDVASNSSAYPPFAIIPQQSSQSQTCSPSCSDQAQQTV